MSAYLPNDYAVALVLPLALIALPLAGFFISRIRSVGTARFLAWAMLLIYLAGANLLCAAEPAGLRMLALIVALLWSMKGVVSVEATVAGQEHLSPLRWLGFAIFWPGMRPALFVSHGGSALSGAFRLIGMGLLRFLLGAGLIVLARLVVSYLGLWFSPSNVRFLATLLLLPGLSLLLHFGLFNVLAGAWRLAGVDCRPLFRAPLRARNLTEFWGRRWNLGFSEMTALAVYRPLAKRLGRNAATMIAFIFSGLLHELAISLPVRNGYGLPLLYFCLHGVLVVIEQRLEWKKWSIQRLGWLAHVWTLGWLALPLPMLFHWHFLEGVIWPLIGLTGVR